MATARLLCCLSILYLAYLSQVSSAPSKEKSFEDKKAECYDDVNSGLWGAWCRSSAIARENCALKCVSQACYDLIYADDALEEGEVDTRRGREFRACIRRESKGEDITKSLYYD